MISGCLGQSHEIIQKGKTMSAIELFKKGEPYMGYLYIKNQMVKTSVKGSRYFNMTLSDTAFKTIEAKMWDVKPADEEEFTGGQLVKIKGMIQEYNGNLQLIVNRMRVANEGDDVRLEDYVESAPVSVEEMFGDLQKTIANFKNLDLQKIVGTILEDKKEVLFYAPAAKSFHHAIKGGLLYHTWSMHNLGKAIAPLYPFINEDLLLAGVILHDLGKISEMLSDKNGSVSDYTPEGKLLGHIVSEIVEIDSYGQELEIDKEVVLALKHMVLSHHYEPEFGSPVRPMFPEAELLHHLDIIDARMNTMEKIQNSIEPGHFSEKIWGLDNIQVYRPRV